MLRFKRCTAARYLSHSLTARYSVQWFRQSHTTLQDGARQFTTNHPLKNVVPRTRTSYKLDEFNPPEEGNTITGLLKEEDNASDGRLISYVREVADKHPDCVLITQVGSFYEIYGDDATEWAPKLDLKLAKKGMGGAQKIHMAGFPMSQRDRYLARIVTRFQQPVVLLEQVEDIALQSDNSSKRRVTRVITPGTLVGDSFMDRDSKSYLAGVCVPPNSLIQEKSLDPNLTVGLAWIDVSDGSFFYQSTTIALLMSDLARIKPKEIILDKKIRRFCVEDGHLFADLAELRDFHLMYVDFPSPDSLPSFSRMFNDSRSMVSYVRDHHLTYHESKAVAALLSFVQDKLPNSDIVVKWPERHLSREVMRMDSRSRQALEIDANYSGTSTRGSLHSAIKRTLTDSGSRLLDEWLSAPLTSVEKIKKRQDIVEYFVNNGRFRNCLMSLISGRQDTVRAVQRLGIHKTAADLVRFAQSTFLFREVRDQLAEDFEETGKSSANDFLEDWISILSNSLNDQVKLGAEILDGLRDQELVLEDDARSQASGEDGLEFQPIFRPNASKRLQDLYDSHSHFNARRIALRQDLEDQVNNNLANAKSKVKVSLKYSPRFKYHLHLRIESKGQMIEDIIDAIRAKVPGAVLNQNKKTLCIQNREWELLGMERDRFSDNVRIEESRILKRLSKRVIEFADHVNNSCMVLDVIDVTQSFANLSLDLNLVRPELDYSTDLEIRGGRHVSVEIGLRDDGQRFTENDCVLKNEVRALLITGPNMGGKSTYIRQVALITILAQIGCFVPADAARLGIVDQIFCRVGAGDDLFHGRSTFMMEMLETSNILRNATDRSLAIVDEVGRGTSPREGLAIAYATLCHALQINKCRTLFATHFGQELAQLMAANKSVKGLDYYRTSLKFNGENQFLFDHRLQPGISEASHGLAVAALAGFPDRALQDAKHALSLHEDRFL